MTLLDAISNQTLEVIKITGDKELKKRLYSFGISKGANIKIEHISAKKNTYEINIDDTLVALRANECENIIVKPI